jgi:hypothetical protein
MKQTKTNMEFTTKAAASKFANVSYLGSINSSAKIAKNGKVSNNYTYVLYLLPHKASGYQVCPMATTECIKGCLNTSGRVIMDINNTNAILSARLRKTRLFFEQRDLFMGWLVAELKAAQRKAIKDGFDFSVRLNGTSDLNWNAYKINGKTLFELFPNVQFYDYTKVVTRFIDMPDNYHLTFSYTGYNWKECKTVLQGGNNVAVIFNIKKGQPLPTMFNGYRVIDGDLTDYRPNDGKGIIVGLRWKKIADKVTNDEVRNSNFVVQTIMSRKLQEV